MSDVPELFEFERRAPRVSIGETAQWIAGECDKAGLSRHSARRFEAHRMHGVLIGQGIVDEREVRSRLSDFIRMGSSPKAQAASLFETGGGA